MRRALPTLLALAAAALPRSAQACAGCFGADANSKTAQAITLGILLLLGTVFSVLTALVAAVWRMERRRSLAEAAAATPSPRGAL
jgi:hypothetical protein